MIPIETERLVLRRWKQSDVAPFAEICADKEVMRYIGSGQTMTLAQVHADIDKYENCWLRHGFGQCAIELKQTGQFIGFAGLDNHSLLPEFRQFIEIGWRLSRSVWGEGYATEAARAVMDFASNTRNSHHIISICQSGNKASERIMKRIGLRFLRDDYAPNNGRSIKIYTLQNA